MQALKKNLRNELERAIQTAREISEKAAEVTLLYLGVANKDPQSHLSEEDKKLRRELRIHGRQLGDVLQPNGIQSIELLKEEIAYAHWHRMLFARFLAENNLLMYKEVEPPIPITIEECEVSCPEKS